MVVSPDEESLQVSEEDALRKFSDKRIKKINNLYNNGNTIIYWTARGTMTGINWFHITLNQLQLWGCLFNELKMGKPAYDLFIDDKNINSETYFESK